MDDLELAAQAKTRSADASSAAAAILDRLNAQRGIVRGRLRIAREGNVTTVRINDVYLVEEAELSLINKELHDNLGHGNLRVLLDFKNVRRMSSTAVQMFVDLVRWLRPNGSTLAFCRLRPELKDMMLTLQVAESIPIYPDKPSALMANW
jgi:anti-anti-sigma regulatory factor